MISWRVGGSLFKRVNNVTLMQRANKHHEFRPIGEREIVGWGVNGSPEYIDRCDYPFPSIRFREIKGDIVLFCPQEQYGNGLIKPHGKLGSILSVVTIFKGGPGYCKEPLKEKEKGDWKKLTLEEKKALYRASFCQTFAEFNASTGEWKSSLGLSLVLVSIGIWIMLFMKKYFYQPLPESFSDESRAMQLRRTLDLKTDPMNGVSAKWDYEKDDWKKNVK